MQIAMIITGIILAILGGLFFKARASMKNIPVVDDNDKILTLTDKNFLHQTKNRLVLVDFWASWCAPCRMMAPVLNEVSAELGERVRIIKIDVDNNSEIARRYSVQSVPTIIIFKNGKLVWRQSGVVSKNELKSVLVQNV